MTVRRISWRYLRGGQRRCPSAATVILALLVLYAGGVAAQPENAPADLRAQARFVTGDSTYVGATVRLEVDVMTSTWFLAPPIMPALTAADALVSAPSGHAQSLRLESGGKTYTTLRYTYLISPRRMGRLDIPALTIVARIGQETAESQARTQPVSVQVVPLPGAGADALVADSIQLDQSFLYSRQPLRAGDRVTREVVLRAAGTQGVLIPPIALADLPDMTRYAVTPDVQTLTDRQGGFQGGQRIERSDYVVRAAGDYVLPVIDIVWWKADTGQRMQNTLPAQRLHVEAALVEDTPFDVREQLRELSQGAHLQMPWDGRTLLLAGGLLLCVIWTASRWFRPAAACLHGIARRWHRRWLDSEWRAWLRMRRELAGREDGARLEAFYLWLRRMLDVDTLEDAITSGDQPLRKRAEDALRHIYGPTPERKDGLRALRGIAVHLRRQWTSHRRSQRRDGLVPLNSEAQRAGFPTNAEVNWPQGRKPGKYQRFPSRQEQKR